MKFVYLSGTITGRPKKEVLAERKRATDLLKAAGFLVFDPVSLEKNTPGANFKLNHSRQDMDVFIRKEKHAIGNCHAMLLLTGDIPSDGSWMEAAYMRYKLNAPVIMVSPLRASGKLTSWSNVEMTKVVATVEEAIPALLEACRKQAALVPLYENLGKASALASEDRVKKQHTRAKVDQEMLWLVGIVLTIILMETTHTRTPLGLGIVFGLIFRSFANLTRLLL